MSTLWDETTEKFRKVTDRLGMPIDDGIFDTVVALNVLGISTSMSCEGHLDYGLPYPWIDIKLSFTVPGDTTEAEIRMMQREKAQRHREACFKLLRILCDFYKDRPVSYDRMITFTAPGRMQSAGGDYLSFLSEDERALRMREYQQEMADFTAFLRERL